MDNKFTERENYILRNSVNTGWFLEAIDKNNPLHPEEGAAHTESYELNGQNILVPRVRIKNGKAILNKENALDEALEKGDYIVVPKGEDPDQYSKDLSRLIGKFRGFNEGGMAEEPRFDEEELREIARLQSDPTSEHYYNDPDETFMSKVRRKLEPYGEEFKGFIEYLFSPSKHFGTGQYNEGGVTDQTDKAFGGAFSRRPGFRSFSEAKGQVSEDELMAGVENAASFLIPFYDSGVNISNVLEEYMKPEGERDYKYIESQFTEAGQSAALEAGLLLMGGVVGKYGAKGVKALSDKVKQYEIDPSAMSSFGVGAIKKKAPIIKEGAPTIEAAGLTDEAIDAWREANATSPEFRKALKGRNEELMDLAAGVKEGRVFSTTYRKRADELRPIRKVKDVPKPSTVKEIVSALDSGKRKSPIVGLNYGIPDGEVITARLDIPAYVDYDTWIPTLRHAGKTMYKAALRMKNVKFIQPEGKEVGSALNVAVGPQRLEETFGLAKKKAQAKGNKSPFAVMEGSYVDGTDDELFTMAKEVFDSDEWTQVGYDPVKRGFFYDRETGQAILEADEVIQVGHLVLARNAKKTDPDVFPFNEGGQVMNMQKQMSLFEYGGIADDGMKKDPVSGNDIPPGSLAKEVRDDIPAMLSEGEYVVPADVLRYYGVNFFEGLRNKAKQGLQSMEQNGRIGGEPLTPGQIQKNMSGAPQAGQPTPMPVQANAGILTMPDEYMQQAQQLGGGGFNPADWATVGGSTFGQTSMVSPKLVSRTFVNAETGENRVVQFNETGGTVPPSDVQYTKPPYYPFGSAALREAQGTFKATQQSSSDDGGTPPPPTDPKETPEWGVGVDWTNPLAYAQQFEDPTKAEKLLRGAGMLGAIGGPAGLALAGIGSTAYSLQSISEVQAAKIMAEAQGMDTKGIDSILTKVMGRSNNAAQFLSDIVATGEKNALSALDRLGMKYTRDPKTGRITFSDEDKLTNVKVAKFWADKEKAKTPQERAAELDRDREDDPGIVSSTTEFDDSGTSTTTTIYDPETTAGTLDPGLTTADEDGLNKGGLMTRKKANKK